MIKEGSNKKLGFWSIYFISLGAIIGVGWIYLPGLLAVNAGPSSVFAWLVVGVIILIIALTYSEIGAELPQKSAFIRFPSFAYGKFLGYLLGLSYFIAAALIPMVEARAIVVLLSLYFPSLVTSVTTLQLSTIGVIIGTLIIILFFAINYFNLSITIILNNIFTALKVLLLVFLILILFIFAYHPSNFSSYGGFFPTGTSSFLSVSSFSMVFFALMGFEATLFFSEEVKEPQKNIPRAIIYSTFTAILIFFILQISYIGAINWSGMHINTTSYILQNNYSGLWHALQSYNSGANPLKILFVSNSIPGSNIILIFLFVLTMIAPFTAGLIFNLVGGRALYGLAYENYFPNVFLSVSKKYNTPLVSLFAVSVLSIFLFYLQLSFYSLLSLVIGFVIIIFITSGPVLYALRTKAKELYRPFKVPFSRILAPLAFVIITVSMFSIGFTILRDALYIIFVVMTLSAFLREIDKKYYLIVILIVILFLISAYLSLYNIISSFLSFSLLTIFIVGAFFIGYVISTDEYKKYMKAGYWIIPYTIFVLFIAYLYDFAYLNAIFSVIFLVIAGILMFYLAVKATILSEEIMRIISEQKEAKVL
jgi:amino acid transporter